QNEDRFTTVELPASAKMPNSSSAPATAAATSTTPASGGSSAHSKAISISIGGDGPDGPPGGGRDPIDAINYPPNTPTTPASKVAIGGGDSGAALIALDTGEPSEPERGNWTGRFDFLLSLLGYSVGLGNVWRFPYLCYNNGGGAFLIPFTIMLIIAGLPLMFMELSFGQYAALGPIAIYRRFCPLFRGLGAGMVIVSAIVMLYYNLIIAWTIFYMCASFRRVLPWQNCEAAWSTE
ncbi:sodium- and chloride-dependent neutral and basic amino acid transporter B(0+)-like, partial [Rhagoletis pomonella]